MDVCRCGVHFCRTSFARETKLGGDLGPVSVRVLPTGGSGPVAGCAGQTVGVPDEKLVSVVVLAQLCAYCTMELQSSDVWVGVGLRPRGSDRRERHHVVRPV